MPRNSIMTIRRRQFEQIKMKTDRQITEAEGWKAAWDGVDKDSNPYTKYSSHWSWWNDGWFEAIVCKPAIWSSATRNWGAFERKNI